MINTSEYLEMLIDFLTILAMFLFFKYFALGKGQRQRRIEKHGVRYAKHLDSIGGCCVKILGFILIIMLTIFILVLLGVIDW